MKDVPREELESSPIVLDALECIDFCLDALYADTTHTAMDTLTKGKSGVKLTYEELIGTLIAARKELKVGD